MILPVVLIALLLSAETDGKKIIKECNDWACFGPDPDLETSLKIIQGHNKLEEDFPGILMIRPLSKKRWQVVLNSWKSPPFEVKVIQGSTELFACKNDGSKSTATSTLPGFEKMEPLPSLPTSCQFLLGDGADEVLLEKGQPIKMLSGEPQVESTMKDKGLLSAVDAKLMCDLSTVLFEQSAEADEVVKEADVQLETVSCTDTQFKLQYKSGDAYEDATSISCVKENTKYQYKIDETLMDEPFRARCMAKVCSFCSYQPTTPAGKTAPSLADEADCKKLTCPKFFKIGDVITADAAVCAKGEGDEYKWKIEATVLEATTEVECVAQKPCKTITSGCDSPCFLNTTTAMPSCPAKHTLSTTIAGQEVDVVSVHCDGSQGQLTYTADSKTEHLPDDAKFACTPGTDAQKGEVAAAGVQLPGALQTCLIIATVLCLIIIGISIGLYVWKRRKNNDVLKKVDDNKSKTGEN